jgi:HEAT repeat protein
MSRSLPHTAARALPALVLLGLALPARAQSELSEADVAVAEPPARGSPLARFGLGPSFRRLESERLEERLRAIERLGERGDAAALERLASHAVERRSRLLGREWLALSRALARGTSDAKVQLALAMLLNQAASTAQGPEEAGLFELARGTAALALAAEGDHGALLVLGRALRARGAPARAAAEALLAHPPRALDPLLEPGAPSSELATLLGALGDQRAFHVLRGWVRGDADVSVRAAAALALTRLGHLETVPLGARWLEQSGELADAGLDILLAAHDPRAAAPLAERLVAERVSDADRRRLLDAAGPELSDAALASVERAPASEAWRWALLGRIGGDAATQRLARALGDPISAFAAAQALSRVPGRAALAGLEAALAERAAQPLGVRAAAIRSLAFGDATRGLAELLDGLHASATASERAAAAWARALGGGAAAVAELESGDEARVLAAASHVYGFDDAPLQAMVALVENAPPGRIRRAASACLVTRTGRERVSSAALWSLIAEGEGARPLAVRALAARDDPGFRGARSSLLADPDPLLRAHVARGLGESTDASAVGLLVARLAVEPDAGVRHAIVIALGTRQGRSVSTWLARSARLDPSARVRSAARLALAGVPLADPPPGRELLWLELHGAEAATTVLLEIAPGLALPVLPDPSGVVVASALPAPEVGIRLQ